MVYLATMANPAAAPVATSAIPRPAPEAEEIYRRWLQFLDEEFIRHCAPERRSEIVRDQLYQIYLGRPAGQKLNLALTSELPGNVLTISLDPENVTMEAEHFSDVDRERFARRKPLIWFWQMFDRSPIGLNHWLGIRFRCMLGRHIFQKMGSGVRIFHGVEFAYGYNLSIGDGAVIRQGVLLQDRGGITIGRNAIIGSYARILSFRHSPEEFDKVTLMSTEIGDGALIGSHTIVQGGSRIAEREIVGDYPTTRN
jgi:acetyltransferase-like isoleucine patch superfamily enzyme